jgi:hypothetical protein
MWFRCRSDCRLKRRLGAFSHKAWRLQGASSTRVQKSESVAARFAEREISTLIARRHGTSFRG